MAWDDVCGAASLAAEPVPEAEGAQTVTDPVAQPLTRADCDKAGMAWDDNANVCGAASPSAEKTGLKNTQVVLVGSTPGDEGKVANKTRAKSSYHSRAQYENYDADFFSQPRRRGGIFRRLFGG